MSDLPHDARACMELARRDHEPSLERLEQIRRRVLAAGAASQTAADMPAGATPSGLRWKWIGVAVLTLSLSGLLLRAVEQGETHATRASMPRQQTEPQRAPVADAKPAPIVEPAVTASLPAARTRQARAEAAPHESSNAATPTSQRELAPSADPPVIRAPRSAVTTARRGRAVVETALPEPTPRVEAESVASLAEQTAASASPALAAKQTLAAHKSEGPVEDRLADEVALIAGARTALARADGATAQRLLTEHASRFPAGQLRTERAALRTRERCLARDREGALARYRELRLLAPGSALDKGVRQACGSVLEP